MEVPKRRRNREESEEVIRKYELNFPCWEREDRSTVCRRPMDPKCPNVLTCGVASLAWMRIMWLEDQGVPEVVIRREYLAVEIKDFKNGIKAHLERCRSLINDIQTEYGVESQSED